MIPGLGRSPGEGIRQYSRLENSMDYIVHGVTKSWTRLSNFHFHWEDSTCFGSTRSVLGPISQNVGCGEGDGRKVSWNVEAPSQ